MKDISSLFLFLSNKPLFLILEKIEKKKIKEACHNEPVNIVMMMVMPLMKS